MDYSSKYGMGFVLSDGQIGVHFNDLTKVVSEPQSDQFTYIERLRVKGSSRRDTIIEHTFQVYPPEIRKKVELYKHFTNYL